MQLKQQHYCTLFLVEYGSFSLFRRLLSFLRVFRLSSTLPSWITNSDHFHSQVSSKSLPLPWVPKQTPSASPWLPFTRSSASPSPYRCATFGGPTLPASLIGKSKYVAVIRKCDSYRCPMHSFCFVDFKAAPIVSKNSHV